MTALNEGTIDLGAPVLEATVVSTSGTTYEPVAVEEVEEEVDTDDETEIEESQDSDATIEIQFEEESLDTEEDTSVISI